MAKKEMIIGLDELEATNNDLFIRKSCTDLDKNAQVIVEETHCAIMIKDGEMIDTLSAGKYPIFDKKDKGVSRVDIIYMSKTAKLKANWGTLNKLVLRDVLTDLPMEVGANGEYEVQIKDPRKFYLELVGADKNFTLDKLKERLQGRILSEIEPVVAKVVREQNVAYYDLAEKKNVIAKEVFETIAKMFEKDYGISLYSFVISKIFVANENIEKIENELKNRREEKTAKELAEEVERLGDKEFDREVLLKQLEDANYDKYLEVCKLIGCEPRPKAEREEAEQVDGNKFCNECGEACNSSDKFCSKCGNKLN